jgi:hypothetical protein
MADGMLGFLGSVPAGSSCPGQSSVFSLDKGRMPNRLTGEAY